MSRALKRTHRASVDEYLEFENASDLKHEFVDGIIYAMVGATDRHNLIAFALAADIFAFVKPPCQVFQGQMKLKVQIDESDIYYYPDVMVTCSAQDRDPHFRQQPSFLCEVISPTTERTDRKEKLLAYQQIPTLQEYLIVEQDIPQIELYARKAAWKPVMLGMSDALAIASVGMTLPVAQIYRSVTF